MATFWKIAGLPVLIVSLFFAALAYRSLQVKLQIPSDFEITTVGLDDLGIHLQAPYGTKSVHHALVVNDSSHHLLACEILFDFVTRTGEVQSARRVVGYAQLLSAKPKEREALFKSQPGIAPHSKMLVGMEEPDLVPITNKLPPLASEFSIKDERGSQNYRKLVIRLNAVVIENGEALGPGAKEFTTHLQTLLKEEQP